MRIIKYHYKSILLLTIDILLLACSSKKIKQNIIKKLNIIYINAANLDWKDGGGGGLWKVPILKHQIKHSMLLNKYLKGLNLFLLFAGLTLFACSKKTNDSIGLQTNNPNGETIDNTNSETLTFTPNESFFSPIGTLSAHLRDKTTGNAYNKNEYYDYITNWKVLTDTIIFGIDIKTAGKLIIKPEMAIPISQDGSKLLIYFGDTSKEVTLSSTESETSYEIQDEAIFENVPVGFNIIKLQLKSLKDSSSGIGILNNVHITGPAAKNSKNVMRRYRAKAVHCKWQTENTNPIEISVHELTIISTSQDYYQPITTPFGYTGSTWDKDTQTFGGYNFSLWSYGANDPIPPFYQESHLIAVGPGLEFGTYGHEGTGVKPRGNHPYIGIETNIQTIAVRKVPGETYDTYWSYYLDANDGHWKLYGCGKKYNKNGEIKDLTTGAFVEVPGPASKARNGNVISETQYRGWQMDTSGNWHPINTMVGSTTQNDLSFRDWNVEGNKFSMQMGGWGEPGIEKKTLVLNTPDSAPNYLKGDYLNELYKMPAIFTHNAPIEILNKSVTLNFDVSAIGTDASAQLFWGTEEGLTKEDIWGNNMTIAVSTGTNNITLNNLEKNTDYFLPH